jgi:hypothetical protein
MWPLLGLLIAVLDERSPSALRFELAGSRPSALADRGPSSVYSFFPRSRSLQLLRLPVDTIRPLANER